MAADSAADLALLLEAAAIAGRIARHHFRNNPWVREKPGQGPVTAADIEIDLALAEFLRRARPDYGWLSEECDDDPARLQAERVFILDPIDGTRAFADGQPGFSTALAVAERGRVTAGVVHLPMRRETYAATLGGGATLNDKPIRPSGRAEPEGARTLAGKPQLDPQHWPGGVPGVERVFRPSLAWRFCLVAAGRFDATLSFRAAWEWDIAAGALIATEAGATVTDGQGLPMVFNAPDPRAPGLIVAPPALHARFLELRRPAGA